MKSIVAGRAPMNLPRALLIATTVSICLIGTTTRLPGRQMLNVAASICILVVLVELRDRAREVRVPVPLVALCLWGAASLGWSANAETAIRPTMVLACVGVATIALCCLNEGEMLSALRWGAAGALTANLVFQIMDPFAATTYLAGGVQWRGLMPHKQQLGLIAGFGAAVMAHAWLSDVKHRLRWGIMFAGSLLLMYKAQSSVVFVSTIAAAVVVTALQITKALGRTHRGLAVACVLLVTVAVGAGLSTSLDTLTESTGKDVTLTGRTELWPHVIDKFAVHPLRGFGLNSLWRAIPGVSGGTDAVTRQIRQEAGWDAYSAHNGYLDTVLQLGYVGMALMAACIVGTFVRYMRQTPMLESAAALGVYAFFYILFLSLAESFIYSAQGLFLFIFATIMSGQVREGNHSGSDLQAPTRTATPS